MAKLIGGLHGRPSGNVGGVVYGAARTRLGKVVTARELVYPSNPSSAGQVIQRRIFTGSLYATRHLASGLWQDDFNRSIGQLPGFQSMMSILLNNTDNSFVLTAPPDTPLGNLHIAGSMAIVTGLTNGGDVDLSWTAETGLNGTVNDLLGVFTVEVAEGSAGVRSAVDRSLAVVRSDTSVTIPTGSSATDWIVAVYWKGAGTAAGLLSECVWFTVTSKA